MALPSSPEPSVSISVSITAPESQIPPTHSQLATIVPTLLARSSCTTSTNSSHIYAILTLLAMYNTRSSRTTCVQSRTSYWTYPICCAGEKLKFMFVFRSATPRFVSKLSQGCWKMFPPVPMKDRSVGSSRSVSPVPRPAGPRSIAMGRPSPMSSPTSSLGQSWLSSHHSDDDQYRLYLYVLMISAPASHSERNKQSNQKKLLKTNDNTTRSRHFSNSLWWARFARAV